MQLTTKQFFNVNTNYYVIDVNELLDDKVQEMIEAILQEQSKGWFYASCAFYAFEKARDRDLVKGALSWDYIKKHKF